MKKATKKTGRGKASAKKPAKKKPAKSGGKQAVDIAKVRQSIFNIVGKEAGKITRAVVGVAEAGQLASAKFLFEVAGVYPKTESEEKAAEPADQESLAKLLLSKITPGPELKRDEDDDGEDEEVVEESAKEVAETVSK